MFQALFIGYYHQPTVNQIYIERTDRMEKAEFEHITAGLSEVGKTATMYAIKGFSVLPVSKDKKPLIKFANKPPLSPYEVAQFYQQHPAANVALKTDKFLVIDIDTKEQHGNDGFKSVNALPREWLPDTLTQTTASGGKHLFYAKPTGMQDVPQKIAFKAGIDVKANHNNYVVVAPSVGYHWNNKKDMMPAPKELIEAIKAGRPSDTATSDNNFVGADYSNLESGYNSGKRGKWVQRLDEIINGVTKGRRNDLLYRFGCSVYYSSGNATTTARIMNKLNQTFFNPPLPQKEVINCLKSATKAN